MHIYSIPSSVCVLWQDLVFVVGSLLTVVVLAPTVRNVDARIPLGTSLPKTGLGVVYALTFASMGMPFAAVGVFATAIMWSLVAMYRSPGARLSPRGRRVVDEPNARGETTAQRVEREQPRL